MYSEAPPGWVDKFDPHNDITVKTFCAHIGISRSKAYREIKARRIHARKIGNRYAIDFAGYAYEDYMEKYVWSKYTPDPPSLDCDFSNLPDPSEIDF